MPNSVSVPLNFPMVQLTCFFFLSFSFFRLCSHTFKAFQFSNSWQCFRDFYTEIFNHRKYKNYKIINEKWDGRILKIERQDYSMTSLRNAKSDHCRKKKLLFYMWNSKWEQISEKKKIGCQIRQSKQGFPALCHGASTWKRVFSPKFDINYLTDWLFS